MEVTDEKVADALGGLPDTKMHCSNLAATAIRAAVTRYLTPPENETE